MNGFYFFVVVFFCAVPFLLAVREEVVLAAGFAEELLLALVFVAGFFFEVVPLLPEGLDFIFACSAKSFSKSAMAPLASADAAGAAYDDPASEGSVVARIAVSRMLKSFA